MKTLFFIICLIALPGFAQENSFNAFFEKFQGKWTQGLNEQGQELSYMFIEKQGSVLVLEGEISDGDVTAVLTGGFQVKDSELWTIGQGQVLREHVVVHKVTANVLQFNYTEGRDGTGFVRETYSISNDDQTLTDTQEIFNYVEGTNNKEAKIVDRYEIVWTRGVAQ